MRDYQATCPSHKSGRSGRALLFCRHQKGRDQTKGERQQSIINGITEGLSIAKIQGIKDIGRLVNGIAKSLIQR